MNPAGSPSLRRTGCRPARGTERTASPAPSVRIIGRYTRPPWPRPSTRTSFATACTSSSTASVWRIVEFQHVKPGKGGAFVRTKLKCLDSGAVVDRTFRAGEKFDAHPHRDEEHAVPLRRRRRRRLHGRGDLRAVHAAARLGSSDELDFMQPSSHVQVLTVDGKPSGVSAARLGRARGDRDRAGSRATPSRT